MLAVALSSARVEDAWILVLVGACLIPGGVGLVWFRRGFVHGILSARQAIQPGFDAGEYEVLLNRLAVVVGIALVAGGLAAVALGILG